MVPMMKRATAIISGRVWGVGYRTVVDEVAFNYDIHGYVKYLNDRTVEVVAEGEESALNALFNEINLNKKPVFVKNISISWDEPTNEFTYFDIIRGDPADEMGERLDVTIIILTNMDNKLGLWLDLHKETISEIKDLRNDTKKVS